MDEGRFVQIGTPTEIYESPETRFVASFIGSANMFEGRITENGADHVIVSADDIDGKFYIDHGVSIKEGAKVWVAVRPEKIKISTTPPENEGMNQLKGVVHDIGYLGKMSTYRVEVSEGRIVDVTHPNQSRPKGDRHIVDWDDEVHMSWEPSSAVVLTK
jgi:putrescine transport system ATP-binding protein